MTFFVSPMILPRKFMKASLPVSAPIPNLPAASSLPAPPADMAREIKPPMSTSPIPCVYVVFKASGGIYKTTSPFGVPLLDCADEV